ncbi:hypothetical protein [Methylomagnum sp.]
MLYRGGIPLAVWAGKEARFMAAVEKDKAWEIRNRLARREVPARLRAYLD